MPNRRFGWQTFSRLLVSLLVVLIPFGIYSWFYFADKEDYHVSRNFRVLNNAGQHLSESIRPIEGFLDYEQLERETLVEMVQKRFEGRDPVNDVARFLTCVENVAKRMNLEGECSNNKDSIEAFLDTLENALYGEEQLERLRNEVVRDHPIVRLIDDLQVRSISSKELETK